MISRAARTHEASNTRGGEGVAAHLGLKCSGRLQGLSEQTWKTLRPTA